MDNIIELKNIKKSFGNKQVFDNLNLEVKKGEILAIVGESGKGKTTLLNIIGLIEKADSGDIIINNVKNPSINKSDGIKILREDITFLFQNFALIDEKDVKYNLQIALRYVNKSKKEKNDLLKKALKEVGLEHYLDNKIYQLSGGEQQRVAIARALLKPSKIILADEPTGSLDEKNKEKVLELLFKLKELGKTIIVVTHDLGLADRCDRVYKL